MLSIYIVGKGEWPEELASVNADLIVKLDGETEDGTKTTRVFGHVIKSRVGYDSEPAEIVRNRS